jgi:outer membrane protein assembly factor BamB
MNNDNDPVLLCCPTCNAPLDFDGVHPVTRCRFCGNTSVLPASMLNQKRSLSSAWDEVIQLVGSGNYEKAMQVMQSRLDIDLKQSGEAVKAISSGRLVTASEPGQHSADEIFRIMQRVQSLVESGKRDEALTFYQESFDKDEAQAGKIIDQIASCVQEQGFDQVTGYTQEEKFSANIGVPSIDTITRKTKSAVIVTVLSIVLFIGGLLAFLFLGVIRGQHVALPPDILLSEADGSGVSIAGTFYNVIAEEEFIGIVEVPSGRMLWKSEPINWEGTSLTSSAELLFATDGSTLRAFLLSDGSLAWQTEMSDRTSYGDVPLIATPSRVIVLTADQKITAYEVSSGSQVWSRQLSAYYYDLYLVGELLVVRDHLPDSYDEGFFLLNPLTGAEQKMIQPVCDSGGSHYGMDTSSAVIYDEPANALFAILDEGCVFRFDLIDGSTAWSNYQPEIFGSLYSGYTSLLTDENIYLSNDGSLIRINKSDGTVVLLTSSEEYKLIPMAQSGETLLVRAMRTQGSARYEIWGIDTNSGETLWQKSLKDTEPIDPPDEMAGLIDETDFGFTWHLTDAGLVLITFQGEPGKLVMETLNPADGAVSSTQTVTIKSVGDEFYSIPTVIKWVGNVAYLNIDSDLYSLDVINAKLDMIY